MNLRSLSAMALTLGLVNGLSVDESRRANGLSTPGGWRTPPKNKKHGAVKTAKRAKKNLVKASRRKNRGS